MQLDYSFIMSISRSPIYAVHQNMKQKCKSVNHPDYRYYGGRGIKVCDRWKYFKNFYDDMGERPTPNHTLERIDNDGDYEPSNCKWATRLEQARNRRVRVDNKVGIPGVSHDTTYDRWVVRKVDDCGRRIYLGSSKDRLKALKIAKQYGLI